MRFFHGSFNELPVNLVLEGRGEDYENEWSKTTFFSVLEKYRPAGYISHKKAVFLCHNPDDIDAAGGGTDYICEIKVLGNIQRHDMNWCSEISCLIEDGVSDNDPRVKECAINYWTGIPYTDESISVWEYITDKALILSCEDFDNAFLDENIPEKISERKFNTFKEKMLISQNLNKPEKEVKKIKKNF